MGIFVNQVGYLPHSPKVAVSTFPCNYQVIRVSDQSCLLDGITGDAKFDDCSGEQVYEIDFTELNVPGTYYILAGNGEKSCSFSIDTAVYQNLKTDLIKAFYFQRCGCELKSEHAGVYTHNACHTAPAIFLEDYLQKTPSPTTFDMTGGWHDAGDFGRYASAGAVALGHLLYAYELFPNQLTEQLNIPETGNGVPDILNECLVELEWLLKMQAPNGGVYHKLTSFCHADFLMPEDDHLQFLIYPISSVSTGDFAAVMALASRVYAPVNPAFSAKALDAAKKAWDWLENNPNVEFHNPEGCNTGEYGDDCDLDERLWACAELLRTDKSNTEQYYQRFISYSSSSVGKVDFGWADVSGFASLTLLMDSAHCAGSLEDEYKQIVLKEADRLVKLQQESGYDLAMAPDDFVWGSNMVVCNRSILLILAALISEGEKASTYQTAALEQLHYLLGRNALDVSYVTGHGEHAYKNPHNRPTAMDGIELPMPGWVSGGPFKVIFDDAAKANIPAGSAPMKCYIDHVDSYSTNEITIYWNSVAVFMAAYFAQLK